MAEDTSTAVPTIDFTNQSASGDVTMDLPNSEPGAPATGASGSADSALGSYFGLTPEQMQTNESTSAALKPVVEMLAQAGMDVSAPQEAGRPVPPNRGESRAPTPVITPPSDTLSDIDFTGVPPETVKAIRAINSGQQEALQQAVAAASAAQASAEDAQNTFVGLQQQTSRQQADELHNRAGVYMDKLASAKYGVGQTRSMVQNLATQQVLNVAGNIIRGMRNTTGNTPEIESVMDAAILLVDGQLPSPPSKTSQVPGLSPIAGQVSSVAGAAGRPRGSNSGSAGTAGEMMDNAAFLEGARAILAR